VAIRSWSVTESEREGASGVVRRVGLWRVVFDLVWVFGLIAFFDFTSPFLLSSTINRL